jgi:hypothetical protein
MEQSQIKHLEMIQAVMTRMAQNSFTYKGWAITLVAGIFALAAGGGIGSRFALTALLPALVFWGLDGYYLRQERLFRKLYDDVRNAEPADWQNAPFSMETTPYAAEVAGWLAVCASRTLVGLYLPITLIVIVSALLLFASGA